MSRTRGTKPVPTELKLLRGNPGRRPVGSAATGTIPAAVPEPPAHLGDTGRAAWALYWQHGRAWLAMTDIPILTQLCEAHDEAQVLVGVIRAEGLTHRNGETGRSFAHHLYNDLRGLRREIRELWSLCYLTPTDRGRANVRPATGVDPLDEWLAR